MRLTLPSACAIFLACRHPEAPVAPGPPLPVEPDVQLGSLDEECDGLTQAIVAYGKCPNLDDAERTWSKTLVEFAEQSFAAGKKGLAAREQQGNHRELEDAKRAMALACHRAATSVKFATIRCENGKRPHVQD